MSPSRQHPDASFEQRIPSRSEEAELLCMKVREALQADGLSQFCFAMELLARECVANAVHHGNGNDPAKSIILQLRVARSWIRLQVTDEGKGFAWRKAMQKRTGTEETSGRGLKLYALYADRFQFNRCGNRITLWIGKKQTENGD